MTIRIYPSRLPGEPLETHEHGATTLHRWMKENVRGYRSDMKHPVAVEVDGESIPPQAWFDYALRPDSDVRIYPVPFGLEAATIAWIGVGISVAVAAYSLIMMSNMDKGGYPNKQRGVWGRAVQAWHCWPADWEMMPPRWIFWRGWHHCAHVTVILIRVTIPVMMICQHGLLPVTRPG